MKNAIMAKRVKATKRPNDSPTGVPEKKVKKIRRGSGAPKQIKIEVDGVEKTLGDLEVTNEHVSKCVDAILELAKKNSKKTTFFSDDEKILLQVNSIKVPKTPKRYLRLLLPHMMVGPNDDVALIVPDLAKGLRQDYEKTVDHWETILREKGVTQIKDVLPMNKIKTEYQQYEMRRKLARLYDFFLIDGRIAGHMSHLLGQSFKRLVDPPVPIKTTRDNLKGEIEFGLKKASMRIHSSGNTHTAQVASSSMAKEKIVENIVAACEELKKLYPGGWSNIRSVFIKTKQSLAIPIFYTMKNRNQVEVPKVAPKRPKAFKVVEGELSTRVGDATVRVTPGGRVKVVVKKAKVEDEESISAEGEQKEKKSIKTKKITKDKKNVEKIVAKGKIVKKAKARKVKDMVKAIVENGNVKDGATELKKMNKEIQIDGVKDKVSEVKNPKKAVKDSGNVKDGAEKMIKMKEETGFDDAKDKVSEVKKVGKAKMNKKNTKQVETKVTSGKKSKVKKVKK